MKILVLQACDSKLNDQRKISSPRWESYCRHNGYDYMFIEKEPDSDIGFLIIQKSIIEILSKQLCYDWIFWTDIDTLPMRYDVKLEEYIDNDYDIVVSELNIKFGYEYEHNQFIKSNGFVRSFNTGSMFVKNTEWSLNFLNFVIDETRNNVNRLDPDIMRVLGDEIPFIEHYEKHKDKIKLIPLHHELFSTPIESYIRTKKFLINTTQFDNKSFILHASRDFDKAKILERYLKYPLNFYNTKLIRIFNHRDYFEDIEFRKNFRHHYINFFNVTDDSLTEYLFPSSNIYFTTYNEELAKQLYDNGYQVELMIKKNWVDLQTPLPEYNFNISLVIMFENHCMNAIQETLEYLKPIQDKLFNVYFFNNRTRTFLRSAGPLNEFKFSLGIYQDVIKSDFIDEEYNLSYCPILGNYIGYFGHDKISLCECDMLGESSIKQDDYLNKLFLNYDSCANNYKRYCHMAPCIFEV